MSLKSQQIPAVPQATAEVARAAFPKGNVYMQMRDSLGVFYSDEQFAGLFAVRGQPGIAAWRLALVTVMQFAEGLSDRQAANAVRDSIAWKYALSLELTDAGFDASVLSEFRGRLIAGQAEHVLLDAMLDVFKERGLLKAGGHQRTDSTHILSAVRSLNRLELVGETMRHTLASLAELAPEWLSVHMPKAWAGRYERRFEQYRLPDKAAEQLELAQTIGQDGQQLLNLVEANEVLKVLPVVSKLRLIWQQNYQLDNGQLQWRPDRELAPSAELIRSPFDTDARRGKKRETSWIGYKVHLTEVCEADQPHLITNVFTTSATRPDHQVVATIHHALASRQMLPSVHLVDTGYIDAQNMLCSRDDYGLALVGPAMPDAQWQAQQHTGYEAAQFVVDWDRHHVTCPQGKISRSWHEYVSRHDTPTIGIHFSARDCHPCPARELCTRGKMHGRSLHLRPKAEYFILQARRQEQSTEAFQEIYRKRAGVEGSFTQAARRTEMRRSRYRSHAKTHLQHLASAAALNLFRIIDWLNAVPFAPTRPSPLAHLIP